TWTEVCNGAEFLDRRGASKSWHGSSGLRASLRSLLRPWMTIAIDVQSVAKAGDLPSRSNQVKTCVEELEQFQEKV
ncbi:hypothetical protein, partial [Mesorhizobium sp. M2A.F.Ca.ET.037.01.1.1]|uniref:hypothetical protein n=1 Tax=Mesorhizobium sp. M2A.F.Ca.ET.037.01.1.1 TaxID=2496748 RepID=UPI001AEC9F07